MRDIVELCRRPSCAWRRSLISFIWKPQLFLQVLPNPLCPLCRQPAQGRVCGPVNILQPFGWRKSIWQSQMGHRIRNKLDFAWLQMVDVKLHTTSRIATVGLIITHMSVQILVHPSSSSNTCTSKLSCQAGFAGEFRADQLPSDAVWEAPITEFGTGEMQCSSPCTE